MRHELRIIGITYNQIESGVYALVLEEVGGSRRIPIIIGQPEAQAIECRLQNLTTPRPLTHDTMSAALKAFGLELSEVEIYQLPSGVFSADLVLTDGVREVRIDSRSSDAVALAIRMGAPIFTSERVLEEAGFDSRTGGGAELEDAPGSKPKGAGKSQSEEFSGDSGSYEYADERELKEMMQKAIESEDYETAALIKQELDSREAAKREAKKASEEGTETA